MAEDQDNSQKTEDPTQKRLDEAREKGDIAKSQDVPVWFLMMATAALMAGGGPLAAMIAEPLAKIMDHPHAFKLSDGGAQQLLGNLLMSLALPLGVIFAVIGGASLLGHVIQSRPLWTAEKIKPDLSKLSPGKGLQRMFGAQGWMNLLKSLLKMAAITVAMIYAVWPEAVAIIGGRADEPGGHAGDDAGDRRAADGGGDRGHRADRGDGLYLPALELHEAHAHVAQGYP